MFSLRSSPTAVVIACYHCGQAQEVGRRAQTVTCQHCHKPLQVADLHVKRYDARRKVQTTGSVIVEKRGQIVADSVECGGLIVRGQIKASGGITCRGAVLVGPAATITGDLAATTLAIGAGALLEGFFCVGKDGMASPPDPPPPVEEPPAGLAGVGTSPGL